MKVINIFDPDLGWEHCVYRVCVSYVLEFLTVPVFKENNSHQLGIITQTQDSYQHRTSVKFWNQMHIYLG
jgi:hypothetical protein